MIWNKNYGFKNANWSLFWYYFILLRLLHSFRFLFLNLINIEKLLPEFNTELIVELIKSIMY